MILQDGLAKKFTLHEKCDSVTDSWIYTMYIYRHVPSIFFNRVEVRIHEKVDDITGVGQLARD